MIVEEAGTRAVARALAFQNDGKIVIVGDRDGRMLIKRLNSDGSTDSTFGVNGSTIIGALHGLSSLPFTWSEALARDVVIDSTGRNLCNPPNYKCVVMTLGVSCFACEAKNTVDEVPLHHHNVSEMPCIQVVLTIKNCLFSQHFGIHSERRQRSSQLVRYRRHERPAPLT